MKNKISFLIFFILFVGGFTQNLGASDDAFLQKNTVVFELTKAVRQPLQRFKIALKQPVATISESNEKVLLKWDSVVNATYYKVKRGQTIEEMQDIATNISLLQYTDNSLGVNGTYYYCIVAVDKDNNQSQNSNILARVSMPKTPVLFGGWQSNSIRLSWSQGSEQDRYILYRKSKDDNAYYPIAETFSTTYLDTNVTSKNEYYYYVKRINVGGKSGPSFELKVLSNTPYLSEYVPYADYDEDGLSNQEEVKNNTNIEVYDTDTDGLSDMYELRISKTAPLNMDTDKDGILDGAEIALGTDPTIKNSNGKIIKYSTSIDKKIEVTGKGDFNTILIPIQAKVCDDLEISLINGIFVKPAEIFLGKSSKKIYFNLQMSFSREDIKRHQKSDITIYKVDKASKKLSPLENVTIDAINNFAKAPVIESGIYLLGSKKKPPTFGNTDILFFIENSDLINSTKLENKRTKVIDDFLASLKKTNIQIGTMGIKDKTYYKKALTKIDSYVEKSFNNISGSNTNLSIEDMLDQINKYFENNQKDGKMVFLFTSSSNANESETLKLANVLARKNIKIFPLSFGKNTNKKLLQDIAKMTGGAFHDIDNTGNYSQNEATAQLKFILKRYTDKFKEPTNNIYKTSSKTDTLPKSFSSYQFDPSKDTGKSDFGIGFLSEKYESRSVGGASAIANNNQDTGGKSYGAWQFASAVGALDDFISWLKEKSSTSSINYSKVYKKLSEAKALDKGFGTNFDSAWKELAKDNYNEFLEIQSNFVQLKYYGRAQKALKDTYGFDITERSRALKSTLFSSSIHHGTGVATYTSINTNLGSVPIFRKALEVCLNLKEGTLIKAKPSQYDYSKITDEKLINAVFDQRSMLRSFDDMKEIVTKIWGRQDSSKVIPIINTKYQRSIEIASDFGIFGNVLYYFSGNGPDVQASVYRRLDISERADAIRMLKNTNVLP